MKRAVFLLFLLIVLFLPICANAGVVYQVIDLGTLGGQESWAYSINNNGQIVGGAQSSLSEMPYATLFDQSGSGNNISLHPIFGGYAYSSALCINDNGQIVGKAVPEPIPMHGDAILFEPGTFPNYRKIGPGSASSINNNGQIVGTASGYPSFSFATLYDATGSGNNIYLGSSESSGALSINDNQQIVGYRKTISGFYHATIFDPTGNWWNNIDLGTIDGWNDSCAYSINNNGQIVGASVSSRMVLSGRAILFDPKGDGDNIDLGTLGGDHSVAYSINDCGQIVGWAQNSQGVCRATLFDPTGGGNNIDLNTLIDPASGWALEYASSINNHGWIVGMGINPDGFERAYLLTPEPATLALLGLGVMFLRKRRK